MAEVTKYAPGSFCWAELGTTDAEGAKQFYTELFGWSFFDSELAPGMTYTLLQLDGKEIAALYPLRNEQRAHNVPSKWLPYISVENVDLAADQARSLGGLVLTEPLDAHEAGRLAVIQDPAGATFALWKGNQTIGARLNNQIGTVCWNELTTSDTLLAGNFYSKLFGWGRQVQQMETIEYTILVNDDEAAGGMYRVTPGLMSSWLVYFAVEDCENSVDRALRMGARVIVPAKEIHDVGRYCVLNDPQGAVFAVIRLFNL